MDEALSDSPLLAAAAATQPSRKRGRKAAGVPVQLVDPELVGAAPRDGPVQPVDAAAEVLEAAPLKVSPALRLALISAVAAGVYYGVRRAAKLGAALRFW